MKHLRNYRYGSILLAMVGWFWTGSAHAQLVTQIDNQATGTYIAPTGGPGIINILSNKVSIVLQEVAGISITPTGIMRSDNSPNGRSVSYAATGDLLFYNFDVQNIGNDTTRFFVPNLAQVSSLGSFQKVQYFDGTNWQDVSTGGYTSSPIAVNSKLSVRIVVQVNGSNGNISVTLGRTANAEQSQNQLRQDNPEDVYTVDAPGNTPGEVSGNPINGVREAQATQSIQVGQRSETLAQVNLTIAQPFNPVDNTIGFGLSLAVLSTLPPNFNNITPTDLTGQKITIDGQSQNGILIADAIPLGTKYVAATAPTTDWIPLYYYSSTPIGASDRADTVSWSTTPPDATTAGNVKRVGFFRSNYRMLKGTEAKGFQLKVAITDLTQTQVYNIAQVFGTNPAEPNSSTSTAPSQRLVYDESGDNLPSNYNNDGTPPLNDANQQPVVSPGIVDATVPDSDVRSPVYIQESLGSASANSPAGEFLKVVFKVAAPPSLLNGPLEQPQAVGPTGNNDDFTNKSTALANLTNATFDPSALSFTNTVLNTSDLPRDIKILPRVNLATDLPNGTQITLADPINPALTAIFDYKDGVFSPRIGSPVALVLTQLAANRSKNYTVSINLPDGTLPLTAFPVQILAFIDTNNNDQPDAGEAQNITIDRVYTGFMKVIKESRVLGIDRLPINNGQGDGAFSETSKPVFLDQFIEYRITYSNISTPAPANGQGNKTISATNFVIIEDGRVLPNNWAQLTDHDTTAASSSAGNIVYSNTTATSDATDPLVVRYENRVTTPIAPGQSGTFAFRRKIK